MTAPSLLDELEGVVALQNARIKAVGVGVIALARVRAESAALRFVITHHAEIAEALKDARRWRHARKILPVEYIEGSQREFESYGLPGSEEENIAADNAIDAAMHNSAREAGE